MLPEPELEQHQGVFVVRDDLLPGGTKSRYLMSVFDRADEVVYGSPAPGGAQLALAYCARALGKRATIFVAKRKQPHARTLEAKAVGARVFQVPFGRLNVVASRVRAYAQATGAFALPWGGDIPGCIEAISHAAQQVVSSHGPFDEVWSAAGSGVLTRGLQAGQLGARYFAVRVGAEVRKPGRARVLEQPLAFDEQHPGPVPFPSCPNYDRKAWAVCLAKHGPGRVLFWNVLGPSPTRRLP